MRDRRNNNNHKGRRRNERGASLLLIALGMTMLLGLAGLGVDLVTLYVARSEAQRAADAAALAGAKEFINTGATFGLVSNSIVEANSAQSASQVGNQNLIIGRSPDLQVSNFSGSCPGPSGVSGGCFNFSTQNDPRITVTVAKNMPTYFLKVFGITSVPVSAVATAEAYSPTAQNGPNAAISCVKPWLLPNCDIDHPVDISAGTPPAYEANQTCNISGTVYASYFVYPEKQPTVGAAIPSSLLGTVVNPGEKPSGGAIGEQLQIKVGNPNDATAAGKFWPIFLPNTGTFVCPSCAANDEANAGSNSAALYKENIECCSTGQVTCGNQTINPILPINGDMVGPTGQGVDCLIHQGNNGTGQDSISFQNGDYSIPFTMYSGSNNPYPYGQPTGTQITTSDSLITMPVYDGSQLCSGSSCSPSTVDIQGFLQMFISYEGGQQNSVYAYVTGMSGCGGTGDETGNGGTPVPSTTGSPIPVRLINN